MSLDTPRKGYKSVPWLFGKEIEIPQEWEIEQLEKFSNITMGMSPPSESYNKNQEGLPFYQGVTDFGEKYPNTTMWCSDPKKIAKKDQILFSVRAPVGETNITNEQSCLGRGVCSIDSLENELMYCYFLISYFKKQFVVYAQGTTYDAINRNEIARTRLPFTSNKDEQQKIATILSNVDNLIESTGKVITHSKKVKTGLMQKLLTRGIGHTKFKDTRFGKLPEEWNIVNLKNISSIIDTPHYTSPNYESGIPIIRTSDCDTNGRINYSKTKFTDKSEYENRRQHIDPNVGDILFTREAPCGVAVVVDKKEIAVGQRIILLKTDLEQILNSFMILFLNSFYGLYQTKIFAISTTVERVNISDIKKFLIPLPSLPEQQKIASILSNIDSKITSQEQYKEKLEKLKKSLMQKLLTGEVRV